MRIGDHPIGLDHPPYVIAEIGVNHDGAVSRALELTDAAAEAGADAVKLQYFETDRLMSRAAKLAAYQKAAGETDPVAMLRRLELTLDEMAMVVERAHARGIHAIVTVFSTELVGPAETLPWDAYKTASPDIVNRPLLEALAATGKPMIVSTGASDRSEIIRARSWLDYCQDRLAFLHCISSYPTEPNDAQVGMCRGLRSDVDECVVGYSDHTSHIATGAIAKGAGAMLFEKHITDDRSRPGPDHRASLAVSQLSEYIHHCRTGWRDAQGAFSSQEDAKAFFDAVWGEANKRVLPCERDVRTVSRQSVVSTRPIPAGTVIGREHLTIKRPGTGILAYRLDEVLGRTAARDIEGDVPILDDDLRPA